MINANPIVPQMDAPIVKVEWQTVGLPSADRDDKHSRRTAEILKEFGGQGTSQSETGPLFGVESHPERTRASVR